MPKLSIITPTYNRARALSGAIESILGQSFKDLEHIIVDNLSDDGTEAIVREYARTAPYKVIYIRERDKGIYQAMNKGIRQATGEWVHILNSDDAYASPDVLATVFAKKIDDHDLLALPVIMSGLTRVNNGPVIWHPEYRAKIRHYAFPHPGIITKSAFYQAHGYYDERYTIVSDGIYASKHYPQAKYLILDKPLVIMAPTGLSSKLTFGHLWERVITNVFYHNYPLKHKIRTVINDLRDYFGWQAT